MFEIKPNKNIIPFKKVRFNTLEPCEPLFFSKSKIKYLLYNVSYLRLGIDIHDDDFKNKEELFNDLIIDFKRFILKNASYNHARKEFVWYIPNDRLSRFRAGEDITFNKVLI